MANEFKAKNGVIAPALQLTGSNTLAPTITNSGIDSNISIAVQSKGTGAIDLAVGSTGVNISTGGTVTAVTRISGGSGYTSAPTVTISAPTLPGGVQATATCTITGGVVDTTFTITNAGSGYVEQPTVSFSGGSGSGASAYASVGSGSVIRSLGSTGTQSLSFYVPSGEVLRVRDSGTTGSYALLQASSTGVGFGAQTNAPLTLYSSGASNYINFDTNGTSGSTQLRVSHTASAVNYINITGSAVSNSPVISSQGNDAGIGLILQAKFSAIAFFTSSSNARTFNISHSSLPVNYLQVQGSTAGSGPIFSSQGTDNNIDIVLTPKGTGVVSSSNGFSGPLNGTVGATTPNTGVFTTLTVNAANDLRLADSDSSNYVGFKSPATVSTNVIWTLPSSDGTNGQVLSTNGSGTLSWTAAGSTTPTASITAGETLTAGDLVNVYSDAGVFKIRRATATTTGYEAHGYVTSGVNSGNSATVYFSGVLTGLTGLTPGVVYLSSTAGLVTGTAPTGSGKTVQKVGVAVSSSSIAIIFGEAILLA